MKKTALFAIVILAFGCQKEKTAQCEPSIKGNWTFQSIKYPDSENFYQGDSYELTFGKDSISEWDASYKIDHNILRVSFPQPMGLQDIFYSVKNDTLRLSFPNGNQCIYTR